MSQKRLTDRGANANQAARLPGLHGMRLSDPQAQRAFESLREWVEVRLGARGDAFERAVTLRDLEKRLKPIEDFMALLAGFNGSIESLKSTELDGLPAQVRNGGFIALKSGKLYVGLGGQWREVTLA